MAEITPMMQQYHSMKNKYPDCILFFRLGDFYEMFDDDAKEVVQVLDIALTSRNKGGGEKTPMAGVPAHSAAPYIAKLIKAGYKVAICEQIEDADASSGLVERDVIRVITPGTVIEDDILAENKNNYLVALACSDNKYGISYIDVSTGEYQVTESSQLEQVRDELDRLNPSEIVIAPEFKDEFQKKLSPEGKEYYTSITEDDNFTSTTAENILLKHFDLDKLDDLNLQHMNAAVKAAALLLKYVKRTQKQDLNHIADLARYFIEDYMVIDSSTRRNLELNQTIIDSRLEGSLLSVLDKTINSMGSRLIRKWINQPLLDLDRIKKRQGAVTELLDDFIGRSKLQNSLKGIYDLERLLSKISYGSINPRDMACLRTSLNLIPELREKLAGFTDGYLKEITDKLDEIPDLLELLNNALVEEPPISPKEGGLIKSGYDDQLDGLREDSKEAREWIANLQPQERKRTGISSLKVGFNKVFGYYIEVTKANLDNVPDDYERKQTLSNSERYIIPELKEKEAQVLGAEDQIHELEYNLFSELRDKANAHLDRIKSTAEQIAKLDVLISFSEAAAANAYICPEVDDGDLISITEGRHPVVEQIEKVDFIPNHSRLDRTDNRFMIITGPNMSGKSTYLRQVALITLMAQIGCFVPAGAARIGLVDRIFTRVGASDDLSTGQSTFMVEMNEVSNIISNATARSLVILDEVGRGTSTYDGLSLAWAISSYINNPERIGARTLFATHYHELTVLAAKNDGIKNLNVVVAEEDGEIRFLHKIEPGSASESYGIEVARLAGLPKEIIDESYYILKKLESNDGELDGRDFKRFDNEQLELFAYPKEEEKIIEDIKKLNINNLTPIQALEKLYQFKQELLGDE
ncbi:MAG: DNA mismatch repair protein MutS [Bacillota bacterium]